MSANLLNGEFSRFVMVGVVNTAVYYGIYLVLLHALSLPYLAAHLIGFVVSLNVSFFLNTRLTYRTRPTLKKYLLYPLTQAVNISVSTVLMYVFVDLFHFNSSLAPFAALLFTVPITFVVTGKILKGGKRPDGP